ncbi:MAG: DUF3782 domain-containing protein [Magnetococcales bacterium]|nr:DUF3782 domain-containing protein [Magnetococcales bacterium]
MASSHLDRGCLLDDVVAPACHHIFAERGIAVNETTQGVRTRLKDGRAMGFDLLAIAPDAVIPVLVSRRLDEPILSFFLARLAQFKEFFPRYADCRVMGAVIGIDCEEYAREFAANEGLFVLSHAGDDVFIVNPPEFKPREW